MGQNSPIVQRLSPSLAFPTARNTSGHNGTNQESMSDPNDDSSKNNSDMIVDTPSKATTTALPTVNGETTTNTEFVSTTNTSFCENNLDCDGGSSTSIHTSSTTLKEDTLVAEVDAENAANHASIVTTEISNSIGEKRPRTENVPAHNITTTTANAITAVSAPTTATTTQDDGEQCQQTKNGTFESDGDRSPTPKRSKTTTSESNHRDPNKDSDSKAVNDAEDNNAIDENHNISNGLDISRNEEQNAVGTSKSTEEETTDGDNNRETTSVVPFDALRPLSSPVSAIKRNNGKCIAPIEEGTVVYCKWPENESWYWGKVKKKCGTKYDVNFFDGSRRTGVPEPEIMSEDSIYSIRVERLYPLPPNFDNIHSACGKCYLCKRQQCTLCHACWYGRGHRICLHKMCVTWSDEDKAIQAPTFPDGWTFTFERPKKKGQKGPQFLMQSPRGQKYDNVRRAFLENANELKYANSKVFKRFAGLIPYIYTGCCGKCPLCVKLPCGRCYACCLDDTDKICFQKVCVKMHEGQNVEECPFFPGWKFFFSSSYGYEAHTPPHKNLILIGPDGKKYEGIDEAYKESKKAKGSHEGALKKDRIETFKRYLGIKYSDSRIRGEKCFARWWEDCTWYAGIILHVDGEGEKEKYKVLFEDGDILDEIFYNDLVTEAEYYSEGFLDPVPFSPTKCLTLNKMWNDRCEKCSMCRKKDCGQCQSCVTNRHGNINVRLVCLNKMCLEFSESQRAQPVPDVGGGLRFLVTEPEKLPKSVTKEDPIHPGLAGFCIITESGHKLRGIETCARVNRMSEAAGRKLAEDFYKTVLGLDVNKTLKDHPLLGKEVLHEWIDMKRQRRALYGEVVECQGTKRGKTQFCIAYEKRTRDCVNSAMSQFKACTVPLKNNSVEERDVWGICCVANRAIRQVDPNIEEELTPPSDPSACFNWIVPLATNDTMTRIENPSTVKEFPCRSIQVPGFILHLQAKPSESPGSPSGVYLTCRHTSSQVPKDTFYEIPAGSMVDLGVCAPISPEDCKQKHIFELKNFIHNGECDVFTFGTSGASVPSETKYPVVDISSDITGILHSAAQDLALSHIQEVSGDEEIPSVHVKKDPTGAVHYMLGHDRRGNFNIRADGETEIELKVDFGPSLEKCRLQKGRPRVKGDEKQKLRAQIEQDDLDFITGIAYWLSDDVADAVDYLASLFANPTEFEETKRKRIMLLTVIMGARVIAIDKSHDDVSGNASIAEKMFGLISRLVDCWWGDDSKSLQTDLLSDDFLRKGFMKALGHDIADLGSMDPEDFRKNVLFHQIVTK